MSIRVLLPSGQLAHNLPGYISTAVIRSGFGILRSANAFSDVVCWFRQL